MSDRDRGRPGPPGGRRRRPRGGGGSSQHDRHVRVDRERDQDRDRDRKASGYEHLSGFGCILAQPVFDRLRRFVPCFIYFLYPMVRPIAT